MGIKISKKKFLQYKKANDDYDKIHFIRDGEKPLFLQSWKKQSEVNGLTERENWYIYKHQGKLWAKHIEGYKDA